MTLSSRDLVILISLIRFVGLERKRRNLHRLLILETIIVWCTKTWTCLLAVNCQFFKLFFYMSNSFRHTIFLDICPCVFTIHPNTWKSTNYAKICCANNKKIFAQVFYNICFSYLIFHNHFLQQTCGFL